MRDEPGWTYWLAPAVIIVACLPLAMGWIGPNPVWGVRIPATAASETAWYRANAAAGWVGTLGGIAALLLALGVSGTDMPEHKRHGCIVAMLLTLASAIVIAGLVAA